MSPVSPSELFSIDGKTALVTGGTRGIGRMIAEGFVEAGATVYVASRKAEACEQTAAELSKKGTCVGIPADLSSEEGCRRLAEEIASRQDRLEILVNNAGATWGAPLAEHDEAAFERVLALNVKGVFHLTKFLVPLLQAAGSQDEPARVINIGSVDGLGVPHARDVLVLGVQGGGAPADPAPGEAPGPDHHGERHRAGSLRVEDDGGHARGLR